VIFLFNDVVKSTFQADYHSTNVCIAQIKNTK